MKDNKLVWPHIVLLVFLMLLGILFMVIHTEKNFKKSKKWKKSETLRQQIDMKYYIDILKNNCKPINITQEEIIFLKALLRSYKESTTLLIALQRTRDDCLQIISNDKETTFLEALEHTVNETLE